MKRTLSYLLVSVSALPFLNGCATQQQRASNPVVAESKSLSSAPGSREGGVVGDMAPAGAEAANSASGVSGREMAAFDKDTSVPREETLKSESERRVMYQQLAPSAKAPISSLPAVMPGNAGASMRMKQSGSFGGRSSSHAASAPVTQNPNMYISSTYIGGTGAKDRLEKLINEGVLVDGKRVKLEAFSRNYAQTFPIPTSTALNVVADTERAKIVTQGDRTFLQVGLQAKKGEAPRRPPLNIALVIDVSGSMGSENKMEQAKLAATRFVEGLHANDILSIVIFNDKAQTLLYAQTVGNGAKAKRHIADLQSGGGTNIYDGLKLGYRETSKNADRDGVSLVILLSDGEVSAGINDPVMFQKLAASNVDKDIQTTAIGMGIQFNEDLMLSIAREGKGNYHFLKDGADAQKVFAKELDELTHVVARAVRLRIKLADGVGLVRVLGAQTLDTTQTQQVKAEEKKIDRRVAEELGIGMNRQKQKDEPGIKLLIPNFYHGDNHIVMLEIQVPPGTGNRKIADVFLKYKDLTSRANRETTTATNILYTPNRAEMIASINRNVKKNLLGFQTGEALAQAANLIAQGQVAAAVKKVDERMVVLGVAAREWSDRDLDRDGKLLDRYKSVLAQLHQNPHLAGSEFGDYLKKSLTYAGYQMTK
jgi:Ca-activated chloride channel homolog